LGELARVSPVGAFSLGVEMQVGKWAPASGHGLAQVGTAHPLITGPL
jgi:hypothetical protein